MAEILIAGIQILTNRGSGIDAGDRINCYWDDVANSIVVKHNDISAATELPITSGPDLGNHRVVVSPFGGNFGDHDYYSNVEIIYDYTYAFPIATKGISYFQTCVSTTQINFELSLFNPSFPYVQQIQTPNSASCVLQTCDIRFTSPPIVVNSTTQIGEDGSITVEAISQNGVVKYSLSDFDYSTGGQLSGLFDGLSPGIYTVYAKDQYQCTTSVKLEVKLIDAYAEAMRFKYDDVYNNRSYEFKIYERSYVGDIIEISCHGVEPVALEKIGGSTNDKLNVIDFTKAIISLRNNVDFQYLRLYTQDERKFKGVLEVNGEPVWSGFVVPSVFSEPYIAPPYDTQIELTDGLQNLANIPFANDDGSLFYGNNKVIKLISFLLKKTGLELNIRVGINMYEINHDQTDSDDPLDQTYINYECYVNDKGEPLDCLEVLTRVVKSFRAAHLFQCNNRWHIISTEEEVDTYDYREFDSNGDYLDNGSFDPVLDLFSEIDYADNDHSLEVVPAYGMISVVSNLNRVGTLVTGSFENRDLLVPGIGSSGFKDWTFQINGISGVSFIRGVTSDGSSVGTFVRGLLMTDHIRDCFVWSKAVSFEYGPGDKFRLSFNYGADQLDSNIPFIILPIEVKLGNKYLQENGTWGTTVSKYRFYPKVPEKLEKVEVTIGLPEVTGITEEILTIKIHPFFSAFCESGIPYSSGDGLSELKDIATVGKFEYKSDVNRYVSGVTYQDYYQLVYGAAVESDPEIILPNDYNALTNLRHWKLITRIKKIYVDLDLTTGIFSYYYGNEKFVIDNVDVDLLPLGSEPPKEETNILVNTASILENLKVDLYNTDLPDIQINNAKNNYNNYFKLSDGTPTNQWTRDGYNEVLTIQKIYLKLLGSQYIAPTFKISGSFLASRDFQNLIGFNNTLRITRPGASAVLSNPEFTSNLDNWTNESSGESFVWSADYSGSAQVILVGNGSNSKRLTQPFVTDRPSNISIQVDVQRIPTIIGIGNREDRLIALFYKNGLIVQNELIKVFSDDGDASVSSITKVFYVPSSIDKIGILFQNLVGGVSVVYNVGKFEPQGVIVQEVYKINKGVFNTYSNLYTNLELQLISSAFNALGAGGDSGGGSQTGRMHSEEYSPEYA